jgi:hypothetical protein
MPTYTNAQYQANSLGQIICIKVDINGVTNFVPVDPTNTDYINMMLLVSEGDLVIAPAD